MNQGEDVLNNPKIGVEVSERDTQGNDTTLSAPKSECSKLMHRRGSINSSARTMSNLHKHR